MADTGRKTGIGRRGVLLAAAGVALVGGGAFAARWFNVAGEVSGTALSVSDAHAQAIAGDITLVDIRRPDEWARTGVGEGAHPLDMRRPDFVVELDRLVDGNKAAPIALICARGVRSRFLAEALTEAGFSNIVDVPEGMMGSGAGPGWLRAGLPLVRL